MIVPRSSITFEQRRKHDATGRVLHLITFSSFDMGSAVEDVLCHIATCIVSIASVRVSIVRLCSEWSQAHVARRRSTHHKQRLHGVGQRHRTIVCDIVPAKVEMRDGVVGLVMC